MSIPLSTESILEGTTPARLTSLSEFLFNYSLCGGHISPPNRIGLHGRLSQRTYPARARRSLQRRIGKRIDRTSRASYLSTLRATEELDAQVYAIHNNTIDAATKGSLSKAIFTGLVRNFEVKGPRSSNSFSWIVWLRILSTRFPTLHGLTRPHEGVLILKAQRFF